MFLFLSQSVTLPERPPPPVTLQPVETHLLWEVVARHGWDARHEVAGDEGANDNRASARRLLLQRVPVKVQGGQNDRHLADLTRVT